MKAHLDAIKGRLEPLGLTVHYFAAPVVSSQYLILTSRSWDAGLESGVCGLDASLDTEVRVTAVTGTPAGVEVMLRNVRGLLGASWQPLTVPGRSAQIRFVRSEFITVDRDVTITNTDRHPGVGVDSYRLVSEPA